MDAVQLGRFVTALDEDANVDVGRAGVWHAGDADLAEDVDAIGRHGDADRGEIVLAERGEVVIGKVLDGREVLGLMLCKDRTSVTGITRGMLGGSYSGDHDG